MPVRTKRLAVGTSGAASTFVTIYTAAAGETVIVKEVQIVPIAAGANRIQLACLSGGGVSVPLYDASPSQDSTVQLTRWTVLQPGDKLVLFSVVAAACRYWVSGAELEGVAD